MSTPDYAALYHDYWRRPDRWGSSSFKDAGELAAQVLATCGPGRTLDAGCGMGVLVRTLLAQGVDAVGADVASPVIDEGNRLAAGRFVPGSLLGLPFGDGDFQTVVCTDVLEHLAEEDVDRAIAELARVARRNVFVTLSTAPDRDNTWHLTIRPRAWWEDRFFRAGLRRHPLTQKVLPFWSLENEGPQITIVLEKVPAGALRTYPLESLAPARDLHMDMLREGGRRSDAHVARYTLACDFVRPGDVVLDAACGMGYGAAILGAASRAARVIGVDADAGAVAYAAANYADAGGAPEFRAGDAADLSFLPDRSVDLVVSFETLEHVPDPRRVLAEFGRVLTPGGRVIVSVPNQWTDESGKDPNPHHLHVYTWEALAGQLAEGFLIERAYAQTAGGGMTLTDRPRRLDEAAFNADPAGDHALRAPAEAEWFLAVAMKSPLSAGREGYRETAFPDHADLPGFTLTTFAREYDNPWLVRSLVSIGLRCTNPELLEHLARGALERARPGSPDEGAALCVLGYRLLDQGGGSGASDLPARIEEYQRRADDSPHAWRWCISTRYVAARLLLARGDRAGARGAFLRCARMDCTRFSPLLASKTIDAYFRAGLLCAADGDESGARECWTAGLEEARRVLQGDWTNVWGTAGRPVTFGVREVAVLTDLASRCSYALDAMEIWGRRPGLAWSAAVRQTFADSLEWIGVLSRANDWMRSQLDAAGSHSTRLEKDIAGLTDWIKKRDEGVEWLREHGRSLEAGLRDHLKTIGDLREHVGVLENAKAWLAEQAESWKQAAARAETALAESHRWNRELDEGRRWLETQANLWRTTAEEREKTIAGLNDWNKQLQDGRDYLAAQAAAWEKAAKGRDAELAEVRARAEQLAKAKALLEDQVAQWRTAADEKARRAGTTVEVPNGGGERAVAEPGGRGPGAGQVS